jgi:hypothetical protein
VYWDGQLQTSEAWRPAIDEWIWRCDAAVLVLSSAATQSDYVAYEATLLRQRWKHTNRLFTLVPVWCPGVTAETLGTRLAPIQLAEIQTNIKLAEWPASDAALKNVLDAVELALNPVRTRVRARHDVEETLIRELNLGTKSEEALSEIADIYELPAMPGVSKKDRAISLARHLLDFERPVGLQRFQRLASGVALMWVGFDSPRDHVPPLINLVAPFCWVAPHGALRLAGLSSLPPGALRVIAWRRSWPLSEAMYLYRAYCTRSESKLKIATASDCAGGDQALILDHIRSSLGQAVCGNPDASEADSRRRITKLVTDGVPVFLRMPANAADAGIVQKICETWPGLCVILFAEKLTRDEVKNRFPGVGYLEPELPPEDEADARAGWDECMAEAKVTKAERLAGAGFIL